MAEKSGKNHICSLLFNCQFKLLCFRNCNMSASLSTHGPLGLHDPSHASREHINSHNRDGQPKQHHVDNRRTPLQLGRRREEQRIGLLLLGLRPHPNPRRTTVGNIRNKNNNRYWHLGRQSLNHLDTRRQLHGLLLPHLCQIRTRYRTGITMALDAADGHQVGASHRYVKIFVAPDG
jgi:hypothetical protein